MVKDCIWLKWGTYKEIQYSTVEQFAALKRYRDAGPVHFAGMDQQDNAEQKKALCELIDAIAANGGDVIDAWSMRKMTADEGKRYVMESP